MNSHLCSKMHKHTQSKEATTEFIIAIQVICLALQHAGHQCPLSSGKNVLKKGFCTCK